MWDMHSETLNDWRYAVGRAHSALALAVEAWELGNSGAVTAYLIGQAAEWHEVRDHAAMLLRLTVSERRDYWEQEDREAEGPWDDIPALPPAWFGEED